MRIGKLFRSLLVLTCSLTLTSTLHAATAVHVPHNNAFKIAAVPGNDENSPALAYDPGRQRFLVANVNVSTVPVINAVCLNRDGSILATYVLGNGNDPDTVYDPSNDAYIVVFEDNGTIMASRIAG